MTLHGALCLAPLLLMLSIVQSLPKASLLITWNQPWKNNISHLSEITAGQLLVISTRPGELFACGVCWRSSSSFANERPPPFCHDKTAQ